MSDASRTRNCFKNKNLEIQLNRRELLAICVRGSPKYLDSQSSTILRVPSRIIFIVERSFGMGCGILKECRFHFDGFARSSEIARSQRTLRGGPSFKTKDEHRPSLGSKAKIPEWTMCRDRDGVAFIRARKFRWEEHPEFGLLRTEMLRQIAAGDALNTRI
jgi:hypothetical protein